MKKFALTFFMLFLLVALGGCQMMNLDFSVQKPKLPDRIRLQVFEVPELAFTRFVPLHSVTTSTNSAYSIVQDNSTVAADLLFQGIHTDAGLLIDETRDLPAKPGTELWNYPTLRGMNPVHGTVGAYIAINGEQQESKLRLEGKVQHFTRGAGDTPSVQSGFWYQGPLRTVILAAPVQRADGQKLYQVLVFTFASK